MCRKPSRFRRRLWTLEYRLPFLCQSVGGWLRGGSVDRLTVDFVVLGGLAGSLAAQIDATDRMLDAVDQVVADLEAGWEGDGQEAFHEAMAEWFAGAREMRDELHRIREFVVTAHGNHAGAVETNSRIWRV